jgi:anti-sigma factor RsiW
MLLDAHLRALQRDQPVDVVPDDRHIVRPWFAGRIGVSPPVMDYAAEGFRLLGGRVDIVDGAPAAALAYQQRAHVISLFVRPAGSVEPAPSEESR